MFSPTKFFGTLRQKIFRQSTFKPLPLLCIFFFDTGSFLKHNTKGFPCESFQYCGTKNFRRKILIVPSLIHRVFRHPNFPETQHRSVPLRIVSALQDKKNSTENLDTPPFMQNLFRYRMFSETQHKRVPLPKFSELWYKKLSKESLDSPLSNP